MEKYISGVTVDTNDLARLMSAWSFLMHCACKRDVTRTPDMEYHIFIWEGDTLPCAFIEQVRKHRHAYVHVCLGDALIHEHRCSDENGEDGEFELLVKELTETVDELADYELDNN